jgi:hypothetical protein
MNVLLYDHQTESLWSQFLRKAVTGPMTSTFLNTIPLLETTWGDWKKQYPETLVLSIDTGYNRNYHTLPYRNQVQRLLGVRVGEEQMKAYPFNELRKVKQFPLKDRMGGKDLLIHFDSGSQKAWATTQSGKPADYFISYLDAWLKFFPKSQIFKPE